MPSSPHEFFKVFLLSSDYRPSIDRPSTERWPITDRYIGEVSTNYRRSVGEKSAKCRWSIGERKAISTETHLERLSTVSQTSVVRLPSESRPTINRYIDRVLADYRPRVDRVLTDFRPLYRPIDRSTLPTVNMLNTIQIPFTSQALLVRYYPRFFKPFNNSKPSQGGSKNWDSTVLITSLSVLNPDNLFNIHYRYFFS